MKPRESEQFAIALRILTAASTRAKPADADALLLYLHSPGHDYLEPDELACIVVRDAMEPDLNVAARSAAAASYFG